MLLPRSDPDFVVYDVPVSTLHAYRYVQRVRVELCDIGTAPILPRVKAAIFDLFLALGIAGYLSLWYLIIAVSLKA